MTLTSDNSTTRVIVDALTKAIVEHRLHPGTKLAEQKLADHFGVSRTLVRQALFQLAQKKLIRMEPARGAFVATPSSDEARQVFAARRMIELEMTRTFGATSCSATSTCAWPNCLATRCWPRSCVSWLRAAP